MGFFCPGVLAGPDSTQLLWRPLVAWSEKFRFEQTKSGEVATSPVLTGLRRSRLIEWLAAHAWPAIGGALDALAGRLARTSGMGIDSGQTASGRLLGRVLLLVLAALAAVWGIVSLAQLLGGLSADDWLALPAAAGATLLRITAALLIGTLGQPRSHAQWRAGTACARGPCERVRNTSSTRPVRWRWYDWAGASRSTPAAPPRTSPSRLWVRTRWKRSTGGATHTPSRA